MELPTGWLPALATVVVLAAAWIAKKWLIAWIDQRARLGAQTELETHKAELETAHERIAGLRSHVLGERATRNAILDQRRIEVVARIWESVNNLASNRLCVQFMQKINVEEAAKHKNNDRVQEFCSRLLEAAGFEVAQDGSANSNHKPSITGADEPFVSAGTWALFATYKSVAIHAVNTLAALSRGVDPIKFLRNEELSTQVKAVLPGFSTFMDDHGHSGAYFLLDDIKQSLLMALRTELQIDASDPAHLARLSFDIEQAALSVTEIPEPIRTKDALQHHGATIN